MSTDTQGIDHVGITVADLEAVSSFFVDLGFEVEGRTFLEGDFLDTIVGLTGARTEMVMLRPPDGGTRLELTRFVRPAHHSRPPVLATELGLSNVSFQVRDLQAVLDRLEAAGYGLIGGVGQHEQVWRMASVRGPEGIIVNFAERIG